MNKIEALYERFERLLKQDADNAEDEFSKIGERISPHQIIRGGDDLRQLMSALSTHMARATDQVFGEMTANRAGRSPVWREIESESLGGLLHGHLSALTAKARSLEGPFPFGGVHGAGVEIEPELEKLRDRLNGDTRDLRAGVWRPRTVQGPPMVHLNNTNNTVNNSGIIGGFVQQGGDGAVQVGGSLSINGQGASNAIKALEEALKGASLSEEATAEALDEVAVVRRELRKPAPSRALLEEAGRVLLGIGKTVAGSVAEASVKALLTVLGLPST